MGNTADVRPEIGSRTSEDSDVRCDMIFDDVGCASRNPLYLLALRGPLGRTPPNTQSEQYAEAYNQYCTNLRL